MKILMVTMSMDIGGAETHIIELCKALQAQGHQILLASNGGAYAEELCQIGIRHFKAPLHRRSLPNMRTAEKILRQVILQEKPDIVHAHARIPAFVCGRLKKKLHFAFVTTAHWVFQVTPLLRVATNWGQYTIAVSDDIKDYLIREYGLSPSRISVTVNGIDTEKFSPKISGQKVIESFSLDPSFPIISAVSRLDSDRAQASAQLIELAPRLSEKFPGIQLLIAGGGDQFEQISQRAEQINQQLGRKCVFLTGPRTDINEIIAAGDIFVGVSRAALEAMSVAKPVIVAGNEGYHGIFSDDKLEVARAGNFCCRGLPLTDEERLFTDVCTLLSMDEAKKQELGAYGREVVLQYYSAAKMANDCLSAYQITLQQRRLVLCGYYGFDNAGDDAILQSIICEIQQSFPHMQMVVLSKSPSKTQSNVQTTVISRFNLFRIASALRNSDALIFGGGSLLQDVTSTRSLLYYLLIMRMAQRMGKPIMLYANGIGPLRREKNRQRVKKALSSVSMISLRDAASARQLQKLGVSHPIHITTDPVFQLPPASNERAEQLLSECGVPENSSFVAVSVRDWPCASAFYTKLAEFCDALHTTYGFSIVFVMMQPSRDQSATALVRAQMQAPSFLISTQINARETMAILGSATLCLAMRLHALIFAARMAVPSMGLVYDPKVESYLKELDLPAAGWVEHFDVQTALKKAEYLLAERESICKRLQEMSEHLGTLSEQNQQLLGEMLGL